MESFQKKEGFFMVTVLPILQELHPDVDFHQCQTLVTDKILESFGLVSLIAEIASEFDVLIPPEALGAENFNSLERIDHLVNGLLEQG